MNPAEGAGDVYAKAKPAAATPEGQAKQPSETKDTKLSARELQSVAAMCEGGQIADVIAAVASIDPVMGGVDR